MNTKSILIGLAAVLIGSLANFNFTHAALTIEPSTTQNQDTIKPKIVKVQVVDLRGQGDSIAAEKAIYNSRKNVLILLVRSTNPEHIRTVKGVAHALKCGGRTRIVMFLSDKPKGVVNDATLFFVNGKFVRVISQTPNKLTSNMTLLSAIKEEYDKYIH